MGEGKLTPLTTPTPLNRQSRNIARTHDYVHDISQQAAFGQDRPSGYFSPYSQSYHLIFFISFYLCTQNLSTDLELRPLNRFCHAIHHRRRVFTQGSAFWVLEDNNFTSSPSKPQKTHFWAHIMESLWEIHIRITARSIEIRC